MHFGEPIRLKITSRSLLKFYVHFSPEIAFKKLIFGKRIVDDFGARSNMSCLAI